MIQRQEKVGPWILAAAIVHGLIIAATPAVYFAYAREVVRESAKNVEAKRQPPIYSEPADRRTK